MRQLTISPVTEDTRAWEKAITERRGRGVDSLDSRKSTCSYIIRDWRVLPKRRQTQVETRARSTVWWPQSWLEVPPRWQNVQEVLEGKGRWQCRMHVAAGVPFCWWRCSSSTIRPWNTYRQFLSGLRFPAPALQRGTLALDCSHQTQLSSAAHRPRGALGSGTSSGCQAPPHPLQAELFSGGLRRQWLRSGGGYSTSCHQKYL